MSKKIILVEHQRDILKKLTHLIDQSSYETVCFESAEKALLYLDEHQVDMVVSNVRMCVMEGAELLRKVKERYPKTLRVAMGTSRDSSLIYSALEENLAKMYLLEPWDDEAFLKLMEQSFQFEDALKSKELLAFINNMEDLPTVPTLYTNISAMISQDEDMEKIAALIESDQTTSAKILRIGNSAFFGKKTGSIKQAMMFIGLSNVKNIVLASSVFVMHGKLKDAIADLWEHSTLTNRYTNLLYQRFLKKKLPTIFASAGLLHNIGMVALLRHNSKTYSSFIKDVESYDSNYHEKEKELFGISHQDVGGYLLNWWDLPSPIVEAAMFHHDPLNNRIVNSELVKVIHISNILAWMSMKSDYLPADHYVSECCESLGLDLNEVYDYFEALNIERA